MNKSKYLALITAVSIMSVGVGYAAWSQSLTVTHEVSMGHLKVNVEELGTNTKMEYATINGEQMQLLNPTKNDGSSYWITKYLTEDYKIETLPYFSCQMNMAEDKESLSVLLKDIYPGVKLDGQAYLVNQGTIPIKFESVEVIPYADSKDAEYAASKEALDNGYITITRIEPSPNDALSVGRNSTVKFSIKVSDDMPNDFESTSLKFHFTFVAKQNTK